jgi:hypothetical protein
MTIMYQGHNQLEQYRVKTDTIILFKDKYIEFLKINETIPTTIPYHLVRTIQEK